MLRAHGGDPTIGRTLLGLFLEAGIAELSLRLGQESVVTGEVKALPILTLEATADAIVAAGVATDAEVRDAVADLEGFLSDPRTLIGDPRTFGVWARRGRQR